MYKLSQSKAPLDFWLVSEQFSFLAAIPPGMAHWVSNASHPRRDAGVAVLGGGPVNLLIFLAQHCRCFSTSRQND